MNCPGCSQTLKKVVEADVEVDICSSGCGGVWFDQFEFKKFDEPHEPALQLLKLLPTNPTTEARPRRNCAKCDSIVMMRAFHSPRRQIEIDECPMCASIWLDHGELTAIREMFSSEE
jgi:Zn-finger nucleic acid-binding protein